MQAKIKQRLVGVIVLIVLMLIFIPLFFTGSKRIIKNSATPAKIPAAPTKPVVHSLIPKPKAFNIQLGSFMNLANANKLVKKLQVKGFAAYIRTNGKMHRVFIGPEAKRKTAENIILRLQKELKLKGIIVEYQL